MIGKRLAELREQAGLSQEDLGVRAGLHGMSISKIERGVVQPKLATVNALARALGLEPGELLAAPDPEPESAKAAS